MPHLVLEVVSCKTSPNLQEEDGPKHAGECESHAVALVDSTATSKERHKEDDEPKEYQEDRSGEVLSKKVQILAVCGLDHNSGQDQHNSRHLHLESRRIAITGTSFLTHR